MSLNGAVRMNASSWQRKAGRPVIFCRISCNFCARIELKRFLIKRTSWMKFDFNAKRYCKRLAFNAKMILAMSSFNWSELDKRMNRGLRMRLKMILMR